MRNIIMTTVVSYKDQARPSQNALRYCLDYLQHALVRNIYTFGMQNLGMLLGYPRAEKVHVIYCLQQLHQFP